MGARTFSATCRKCGRDFLGRKGASFCARACFNAWLPGNINRKPKTTEHRRRIGDVQRGKPKGPQTDNHRRNISNAKKGRGFSEAHRAALSAAAVRRIESGGFGGRQTAYISSKSGRTEFAHSSYELKRMRFLDSNPDVWSWTKGHGLRIPYNFDGKTKNYIPDFLVEWSDGTKTLEEVKGWSREPERVAAKSRAAEEFALANDLRYVVLQKCNLEDTCHV